MATMNGSRVIDIRLDAVYIRIPEGIAVPIEGGCKCDFCIAHPLLTPAWDTLAIPTDPKKADYAWTVHMPHARPRAEWGK